MAPAEPLPAIGNMVIIIDAMIGMDLLAPNVRMTGKFLACPL